MKTSNEFEARVVFACLVGGLIVIFLVVTGLIGLLALAVLCSLIYLAAKTMRIQGYDPPVEDRKDTSVS